uniref:Uncharacterized protein n=1 Tax=Dromaius novaehollandiae TaxID=8790 RepID=A0A8C4JQX9_DRONO
SQVRYMKREEERVSEANTLILELSRRLRVGSCQCREDIAHRGLTRLLRHGKQLEDTKEEAGQQSTSESAKLNIS